MFWVTLPNILARHLEGEVLKNLFVYKDLILCRAYGHGYKSISLLVMYRADPEFLHIFLTIVG